MRVVGSPCLCVCVSLLACACERACVRAFVKSIRLNGLYHAQNDAGCGRSVSHAARREPRQA